MIWWIILWGVTRNKTGKWGKRLCTLSKVMLILEVIFIGVNVIQYQSQFNEMLVSGELAEQMKVAETVQVYQPTPVKTATPQPTRTTVPTGEPEIPQYDVDLAGMDYLDKIFTIVGTYEQCNKTDCYENAFDAMTKVVYPADCQNCEILHKNFMCMRDKAVEIANAEGLAQGRAKMDYSHCENVANLVMDKIMGLRP